MSTAPVSVASHFADARQQYESASFGMWLFLLTEIMLFGALFTAYVVYRSLHPASFAAASHHLDVWLGTINTAVLIGSSLTVVLAHRFAQERRRGPLVVALVATLVLGSAFLVIKGWEYSHKYHEHLVPGSHFAWHDSDEPAVGASDVDPQSVEVFFSLYFVMTGVHAVHMIIGLGIWLVLTAMAAAGRVSTVAVGMSGLYWHFVDIVWIFLFPLLYLIGRHA